MGILYARVNGAWEKISVGGGVQQVVAGTKISVNAADPTKPVVSLSPTTFGNMVNGAILGGTVPTSGAITRMTADMPLPAGSTYWLVTYNVFLASNAAMNNMRLRMYGVVAPGYFDHIMPVSTSGSACFSCIAPAGATPAVYGVNNSTQPVDFYADSASVSLFAIGLS